MKLRSYFFSMAYAGLLLSCSEDSNIPDVPVFRPDATLSFATSIDGVTATKAAAPAAAYDDTKDANIHKLQLIVFTGEGDAAIYQTDTICTFATPVTTPIIKDKAVQSGVISLLVLANSHLDRAAALSGKTLSDVLAHTTSLSNESSETGYTMSSKVYTFSAQPFQHNIVGAADAFGSGHTPVNELSKSPIELIRNVAKVNLTKLTFGTATLPDGSKPKSFLVKSIFVANVKSVSKLASMTYWGAVEVDMTADAKWWFGAFPTDRTPDDIYSQVEGEQNDLLLAADVNQTLTTENTAYYPDPCVIGKSFLVFENMTRPSPATVPLGEQTVLIVCGDYTRTLENGVEVTEANRYYAVPVNNTAYGASAATGVEGHQYIKRNVKYNISLRIVSTGSSTPYGKDAYAHASAQVEVAPWRVVNMGGDVD